MSWENLIKQSGLQTFAFETEVEYINLQARLESGEAIVKWEFSFEQRKEHMDKIKIEVTDIIDANLSDNEIKMINDDGPSSNSQHYSLIAGKLQPHKLMKFADGEIRLEWK